MSEYKPLTMDRLAPPVTTEVWDSLRPQEVVATVQALDAHRAALRRLVKAVEHLDGIPEHPETPPASREEVQAWAAIRAAVAGARALG